MISITIYLDGNTSECGYKYVVQRDCMAWTAYRTDTGFRRFLAVYGLKINPQYTQLHDMRAAGKGRVITDVYKRQSYPFTPNAAVIDDK